MVVKPSLYWYNLGYRSYRGRLSNMGERVKVKTNKPASAQSIYETSRVSLVFSSSWLPLANRFEQLLCLQAELCASFKTFFSLLQIILDNKAHSGKVKIRLDNQASIKECKDPSISGQGEKTEKKKHLLVVMGLCSSSAASKIWHQWWN